MQPLVHSFSYCPFEPSARMRSEVAVVAVSLSVWVATSVARLVLPKFLKLIIFCRAH